MSSLVGSFLHPFAVRLTTTALAGVLLLAAGRREGAARVRTLEAFLTALAAEDATGL